MPNKHLKKLHCARDELDELLSSLKRLNGDEEEGEYSCDLNDISSNKNKKPAVNLFDLV
jgi:hypothetical protein